MAELTNDTLAKEMILTLAKVVPNKNPDGLKISKSNIDAGEFTITASSRDFREASVNAQDTLGELVGVGVLPKLSEFRHIKTDPIKLAEGVEAHWNKKPDNTEELVIKVESKLKGGDLINAMKDAAVNKIARNIILDDLSEMTKGSKALNSILDELGKKLQNPREISQGKGMVK